MIVDYKIAEEHEVNGLIYQKVRFYEGDETTEDETVFDQETQTGVITPVTRYRRNAMIEEREYWYE